MRPDTAATTTTSPPIDEPGWSDDPPEADRGSGPAPRSASLSDLLAARTGWRDRLDVAIGGLGRAGGPTGLLAPRGRAAVRVVAVVALVVVLAAVGARLAVGSGSGAGRTSLPLTAPGTVSSTTAIDPTGAADPAGAAGVAGGASGGADAATGGADRSAPPGTGRSGAGGGGAAVDVPPGSILPSLWVAVTGGVRRPGLVLLTDGARVAELITAAGGLADDADPDRINLAAPVHDGERVHVPRRGEAGAPPVVAGEDAVDAGASGPGAGSGSAAGSGGGSETGSGAGSGPGASSAGSGRGSGSSVPDRAHPLDLNTASAEQLDLLPGVGPTTAAAIIEHRRTHGPFVTVDDLRAVRGIGPAKLEQVRPLVRV